MAVIDNNIPEIIKEAAKSPLGITALVIIVLTIIAYSFFANENRKMKLAIFLIMFLGFMGFAFSIFLAGKPEKPKDNPRSDAVTDSIKNGDTTHSKEKRSLAPKDNTSKFTPQKLTIIFDSFYENAELFIDGNPTPPMNPTANTMEISLSPGEHEIILGNRGKTCKRLITIPTDETQIIFTE